MLRIDAAITQRNLRSQMTLQVHDELLFDVIPAEAEELRTLVQQEMEHVAEFSVPIVAEVGLGPNSSKLVGVRLVLDTCSRRLRLFRSRNGASRPTASMPSDAKAGTPSCCSQPAPAPSTKPLLRRPEQREGSRSGSCIEIADFLDNLVARSIRVSFDRRLRPQLRDPNDEFVLETAVNGLADAIVTHNTKDFLPEVARFAIPVLTPGHIIRERLKF